MHRNHLYICRFARPASAVEHVELGLGRGNISWRLGLSDILNVLDIEPLLLVKFSHVCGERRERVEKNPLNPIRGKDLLH